MQKPHLGVKVIEEQIKAFKELIGMEQPEPRVSVRTPHHDVKVIEERIKTFKETIETKQPKPRVSVTTPHISVPRVQTSEHTEPKVSA